MMSGDRACPAIGVQCAFLVVGLCAVGALHAQTLERPAAQSTAVARDFRFRDEGGRVVTVSLTESDGIVGVTWPEAPTATWDTALLRVDVAVSADLPTPYVEIASGAISDRQHFRPGDAGSRWLNLSFLRSVLTAGTRVSLREEGVSIGGGSATLRLGLSTPARAHAPDERLDLGKLPQRHHRVRVSVSGDAALE